MRKVAEICGLIGIGYMMVFIIHALLSVVGVIDRDPPIGRLLLLTSLISIVVCMVTGIISTFKDKNGDL